MQKLILILLVLASSSANSTEIYGQVTNVIAHYQTVLTTKPNCEYVTRYNRSVNGGTVIGGISGGLLGTLIGGGTGTMVATGIGAVLGASAGTNIANQPRTEMLCKDVFYPVQVRTGYQVTIKHQDQSFDAFLDHNPGIGARMPLGFHLQ